MEGSRSSVAFLSPSPEHSGRDLVQGKMGHFKAQSTAHAKFDSTDKLRPIRVPSETQKSQPYSHPHNLFRRRNGSMGWIFVVRISVEPYCMNMANSCAHSTCCVEKRDISIMAKTATYTNAPPQIILCRPLERLAKLNVALCLKLSSMA